MNDALAANRERIKRESDYLRGRLAEELADETTGDVSQETATILAFHGVIAGCDRDTAGARDKAGLAREAVFTVRISCPAGYLTSEQYLGLDALSVEHADGTLRVGRGQTVSMHHVRKASLRPLIAALHHLGLSTLATGGDVVLPVSHPPVAPGDAVLELLAHDAKLLDQLRMPKTGAYSELWLGEAPSGNGDINPEPLYSKSYLPAPLSITMALPASDAQPLASDIALIAHVEAGELTGYHLLIGGDLAALPPVLAEPFAWLPRTQLLPTIEALIKLWRDHGERGVAAQTSLRQLISQHGLAWIRQTLGSFLRGEPQPPRPLDMTPEKTVAGWQTQADGLLAIEIPLFAGRIINHDGESLQTLLADICGECEVQLHLTQQNHVLLAGIDPLEQLAIEYKLRRHGVVASSEFNPLRSHLAGCAALPLCASARAESERILPLLLGEFEQLMERYHVSAEPVSIHVAGCEMGCARARLAEIGLIGIAPDRYDVYVGGNHHGTRLSQLLFNDVALAHMAGALEPLVAAWTNDRQPGESLGDYCARQGVDALKQMAQAHLTKRHWVG